MLTIFSLIIFYKTTVLYGEKKDYKDHNKVSPGLRQLNFVLFHFNVMIIDLITLPFLNPQMQWQVVIRSLGVGQGTAAVFCQTTM